MRVNKAKRKLNNNEVIIVETSTVFGFVANPTAEGAKSINRLKGRDEKQAVQLIVNSYAQLQDWIEINEAQEKIVFKEADPYTSFIIQAHDEAVDNLPHNDKTVMFRIVSKNSDELLYKLINKIGPVYASSVNKTNQPELTNVTDIQNTFDNYVLYDGKTVTHKSSRIISLLNNDIDIIRK